MSHNERDIQIGITDRDAPGTVWIGRINWISDKI